MPTFTTTTTLALTAVVVVVASLIVTRLFTSSSSPSSTEQQPDLYSPAALPDPPDFVQRLASEHPDSIVLPAKDAATFRESMDQYFNHQTREVIPACIVRPHSAQELSLVVRHLKSEYDRQGKRRNGPAFFAIRSGGTNPTVGINAVANGVLIDLSQICEVVPSEDGSAVTVGSGAYWRDVYKKLEDKGLTVVGGRSSHVGVGGSTLQGGMSFHSPKYGFICSNVIKYEVVLADGSIVNASAEEHPDLWRALKGGGSNFGIVTRFTLRAIPQEDVWSANILSPGFQPHKTFQRLYDHAKHASSDEPGAFDENASTPILSLTYVPEIACSFFHNFFVYTKPTPGKGKAWPEYWAKSPFKSVWRLRSSIKIQSTHGAVMELGEMTRLDKRNLYATTTIKNDLKTILDVHAIWRDAIPSIKHLKGGLFCIIMQIILPQWMNKGDPNMLGLEDCREPLVIVSFAVDGERKEDDLLRRVVSGCIDKMEETARANKADHPFRFSNYAAEWQRPILDGRGPKNLQFMRDVSAKYDPDGLFQTGKCKGFMLEE